MSKEYKEAYDKVLNILYPGYSDLSDKRKDTIEFRTMGITAHALEIMELFDKMKNPEHPLYQGDFSDKDIINIAAIYARIYKESNDLISYKTNETPSRGQYDVPEEKFARRARTETEIQHAMEEAVKRYNSKPKISIQNIFNGIKKYDIDYNTALSVSKILNDMNNQKEETKSTMDKEMEI